MATPTTTLDKTSSTKGTSETKSEATPIDKGVNTAGVDRDALDRLNSSSKNLQPQNAMLDQRVNTAGVDHDVLGRLQGNAAASDANKLVPKSSSRDPAAVARQRGLENLKRKDENSMRRVADAEEDKRLKALAGDDDDLEDLLEEMGFSRSNQAALNKNDQQGAGKQKRIEKHEAGRGEVERAAEAAEAERLEKRAKLPREEWAAFDKAHPPAVEVKPKFELGGLKTAGVLAGGVIGAHILNEAFQLYLAKRTADLILNKDETRFTTLMNALKDAGADIPGTALEFAKQLIPFVPAYQAYEKGEYWKAAGFALMDGAVLLSFGSLAPVKGAVILAEHAGQVAKIGGAIYAGALGFDILKEFKIFVGTKEGQLALQDARKEATALVTGNNKAGMTRGDAIELAVATKEHAADEIRKEKTKMAANRAGMKGDPSMTPGVAEDEPKPTKVAAKDLEHPVS